MSRISDKEVQDLIKYTCECTGFNELESKINWEWNTRFTDTMGKASYFPKYIELSSKIFNIATKQEQEDCVVHEVCHIIAYVKVGRVPKPHGQTWKSLMIQCGIEPERCHKVNISSIKKKRKYLTLCGCGKSYFYSKRMYNILKTRVWECSKCGAVKSILEEVTDE